MSVPPIFSYRRQTIYVLVEAATTHDMKLRGALPLRPPVLMCAARTRTTVTTVHVRALLLTFIILVFSVLTSSRSEFLAATNYAMQTLLPTHYSIFFIPSRSNPFEFEFFGARSPLSLYHAPASLLSRAISFSCSHPTQQRDVATTVAFLAGRTLRSSRSAREKKDGAVRPHPPLPVFFTDTLIRREKTEGRLESS
jgi:hypothetical protein